MQSANIIELFFLLLFATFIYFIFKMIRGIYHTLNSTQKQQMNNKNTSKQGKGRVIHDSEGEYVDFEEVKNNSKKK